MFMVPVDFIIQRHVIPIKVTLLSKAVTVEILPTS